MPTVPLAPVGGTVETAPARPVYQTGAGDAGAFGAYSAAGEASLGKSLETVGDSIGNVAANLAIQADQRFVKDQTTSAMLYADKLAYQGDGTDANPKGFFAMQGEQALKYAPTYKAALLDYQKSLSENMTDRQANLFTGAMQGHMLQQMKQADVFAMQQNIKANEASSHARMAAATSGAVLGANDPAVIEGNAKIIRGETASQFSGYGPEVVAAETQKALGKFYGSTILSQLSNGNVTQAVGLFEHYKDQMDPATATSLANHLKTPMNRARASAEVNRELGINTTVGDGTSMPSRGGVADTSLPPEQQAFLNTLSGPESAGKYNVRYTPSGGAAFEGFDQHPNVREPTKDGRTSDAAGRYQFLSSTYRPIAAKEGLTDFSPKSQDKAAMRLASDTYQEQTGRDLAADLKEGGHAAGIASALKGQWPSLPGGSQQGKGNTLSKFAAGLGSPADVVNEAASPEANARVAAASKPHPDFGAVEEKLVAKYADDPDMLQATLTDLRRKKSAYDLSVKTDKVALTKDLPDVMAALHDGSDKVSAAQYEQRVRHALEPAQADKVMRDLYEAEQYGQVYRGVREMTPEQFQQAEGDLISSLSGSATPSKQGKNVTVAGEGEGGGAGVAGYAQRRKELADLRSAYGEAQTRLKADPAAYVMSMPDVAGAFQGGDLPAAIAKSQAVQRSLGLDQPRAISNKEVGGIVNQLHSAPEDVDGRALLDKFGKQYGSAWPDVFHDLVAHGHLSPQYQALGAMDTPEQAGAAANFQRALKAQSTKGAEFGKHVPADQKLSLKAGVDSAVADFRETTKYGGGELLDSVIIPSVTTLATYYAEQNQPGSDAAARAYKEIVTTKYDIDGSLRVPKMWQGKPLGASAVRDAGANFQSRLTQDDLEPGITPRQARQGVWATNPDGAGVSLLAVKTLAGYPSYVPVRDKAGKPISFNFSAMPKGDGIAIDVGTGFTAIP